MPKTHRESYDSSKTPPRSDKSARAKDKTGVPFDIDAWEPSLLERMLKANGRKPQSS